MVGHSDDAGPMPNDIRLVRVPRMKWKEGRDTTPSLISQAWMQRYLRSSVMALTVKA